MAWHLAEHPHDNSAVKRIGRVREYTRVFKLWSDAGETTGPIGARNAAGVPPLGSAFFDSLTGLTDSSAICHDIAARMLPDAATGTAWMIECRYQSIGAQPRRDEPLDALQDDPLNRPYSVRGVTSHRESTMHRGNFLGAFRLDDGSRLAGAMAKRPLASSAGEPATAIRNYDGSAIEWQITKNLSTTAWSSSVAGQWANAVNDATWNGYPAYSVRIVHIDWDRVWEAATEGVGGSLYYVVTYHLEYKPDFWYFEFEDTGSYYLDGSNNPVPFLNNGQQAVGYLDGTGQKLTQAEAAAGQFAVLRFLPLDWPVKNFATLPGGPYTI